MAIEIKAAEVMKLRKMTGAGMMDCKKALVDAEGDFERAKEIIKEKGKLVAAKRADRETSEGAVVAKISEGKAIVVGLGCETDFVAKNADFQALAQAIAEGTEERKLEKEKEAQEAEAAAPAKQSKPRIKKAVKAAVDAEEAVVAEVVAATEEAQAE